MLVTLAAGQSLVVQADNGRPGRNMTVIAGAGATVTVSRVNNHNSDSHEAGGGQFEVAAGTMTVTPVDWPFYRVSVAGGSCRVAVV